MHNDPAQAERVRAAGLPTAQVPKPVPLPHEQPTVVTAAPRRRWEVDAWRGVATVLMLAYHFAFDLVLLGAAPNLVVEEGPWKWVQLTCACSFIGLLGVSLWLAHSKGFIAAARRGFLLLGLGLVVSVAVWASGAGVVWFGILSLLGFSMLAGWPLLRVGRANLLIGAALVAAGVALHKRLPAHPGWILLVQPAQFRAVDHFPVLPWFGVAVIGIGLGALAYPAPRHDRPTVRLPDWSTAPCISQLRMLGRHTLAIYLIHQPLLLALIWAWTQLR